MHEATPQLPFAKRGGISRRVRSLAFRGAAVFVFAWALHLRAFAAEDVARMLIKTEPGGAMVYMDGDEIVKTPGRIENIPAGTYIVRITLAGYEPTEMLVKLAPTQTFAPPQIVLQPLGGGATPPIAKAAPAATAASPRPAATPMVVAHASPAPARATPPPATPRALPSPVVAPTRATPAAVASPIATPSPAAPDPTPSETPAVSPAPADEPVHQLVERYLATISKGDAKSFSELFAGKATFFDEGVKSRAAIRQNRAQLNKRWPVYEVENLRDLEIRDNAPNAKIATFTYNWNVRNPATRRTAKGTAIDTLTLRLENGAWQIVTARQASGRDQKK